MPITWRALLSQYLKVLILSAMSFIFLLIVSRLEEIAEIASYGAPLHLVAFFALLQIPTILPIAIPLSSLISSYILFTRLSQTYELTAMRALGLSFSQILAPLLFAATLFSLLNFTITSEIATSSHLKTRKMAHELTSLNPLLLLQNTKIARLKKGFVQLEPVKQGSEGKNLIVALPNHTSGQLSLLLAKTLRLSKGELKGEDVTLIGGGQSKKKGFDHLMIENQKEASSKALDFSNLLSKKSLKISCDHLRWGLLRARMKRLREEGATFFEKNLQKCYSEIMRRLSLGLSPLTFTLLGASFGIQIGRGKMFKGIAMTMGLAAFSLVAFFLGKGFDHLLWVASLLFLLPHFMITFFSSHMLGAANRGVEG